MEFDIVHVNISINVSLNRINQYHHKNMTLSRKTQYNKGTLVSYVSNISYPIIVLTVLFVILKIVIILRFVGGIIESII